MKVAPSRRSRSREHSRDPLHQQPRGALPPLTTKGEGCLVSSVQWPPRLLRGGSGSSAA